MSEFKKPETVEEYNQNFAQIKPLMNATMAYYESSRCLFCYDAPCIKACPTEIDIPLFIRQINTGNVAGAAKTIYSSNYFGNTCGKVCPTEVLCEGACVYNHQDVAPIEIGRLQNHASNFAIENNISIDVPAEANGKKVAVVGAGPAGVSCACALSSLGYVVTIFEAKGKPGGLALYGTAPYKILNEEVTKEIEYLQKQYKFDIIYNNPIQTKDEFDNLEKMYDAIFIGIGMADTRSLGVEGESLPQVIGAVELIEKIKMNPTETHTGNRVVVIGGGNTAMDAASEAARMGADEVTLIYRRSINEMSGYDFELDLAKSVGVKALFNVSQVEIIGNQDAVKRIKCMKTHTVDGKLLQDEDSEFFIDCDMVIKATGQRKYTEIYEMIGVDTDDKGRIALNDQYQTNKEKYFAGGDAFNGGAEVVNACAEGKKAAAGIHSFLSK